MEDKKSAIDFLDTTSSTQFNTSQSSSIQNISNINYLKVCTGLWNDKKLLTAYQKGLFMGKGDYSNILFQEFLKKFRKVLEEIVREELKNTNQTSETFKDDFKVLEHIFNIIINHLALNKIEIKDEKIIALLHGFINAYVDPIINQTR